MISNKKTLRLLTEIKPKVNRQLELSRFNVREHCYLFSLLELTSEWLPILYHSRDYRRKQILLGRLWLCSFILYRMTEHPSLSQSIIYCVLFSLPNNGLLERSSIECRKTKTKLIAAAITYIHTITKNIGNPVNQSKLEANTRNWREAREKVRGQVMVGCGWHLIGWKWGATFLNQALSVVM